MAEGGRGGKARLEPAVRDGLPVAQEVAETQCASFVGPPGSPQRRAARIREEAEEQAPVELTQGRPFVLRRQGAQLQRTFPRLEPEFDVPP